MRKTIASMAAAAMLLAAPLALAQGGDTLKIGNAGALSGDLAPFGLSSLYGLEYAVEKQNAEGGLLGKQIEIVSADDACDPALAPAAAKTLQNQGLTVIFGHTCSGATRAALGAYENKALLLSSGSTEPSLTDDGQSPYFFRTTPRDDAVVRLWLQLAEHQGFKKLALLNDKSDFGKSLVDMFKAEVEATPEAGLEIVYDEAVSTGAVTFEGVLAKVRDSGAEALVWGGYVADAAKLAVQMRGMGLKTALVGPDGIFTKELIERAGEAAEGVYCAGQSDMSRGAAAKAALADHAQRHPGTEPGPFFLYAAAGAQAVFAAIEKAGDAADLEGIKKHLLEDEADTVIGPVGFDEFGDITRGGFTMYQVKGGQFAPISVY